jgi:hypothetical protein
MRTIPTTFKDPFGLAGRVLRSRDRAAYFALALAASCVAATPLDLLLAFIERRHYARARPPHRPVIFVTGAPRSGTTVVSQVLLHHLPVTYFNNLTQVFPRAPIVANRIFGRLLRWQAPSYQSFYGRTWGLAGINDGLHLWDRWWGPSRYVVPERFDPRTADDLVRFFGAYEAAFDKPILDKNNALATCASLIARTLPTAHFVCVQRDPAFAVQSILVARERIQGSRTVPYGVEDPGRMPSGDPIEDVCAQVLYHERKAEEQRREIGDRRFWIVRYEDVSQEPYRIVERVADEILRVPIDRGALSERLPPLRNMDRVTLPRTEFDRIETTLRRQAVTGPGTPAAPAGSVCGASVRKSDGSETRDDRRAACVTKG